MCQNNAVREGEGHAPPPPTAEHFFFQIAPPQRDSGSASDWANIMNDFPNLKSRLVRSIFQ